jgi:peptidoglycan/LPS O-acetylase OafA/YrhL
VTSDTHPENAGSEATVAGVEVPVLPTPQGAKIGRLSHLDALRGIAAVLVMIQHSVTIVAKHPSAPEWYRTFAEIFNGAYYSPGRTGVVAFFLISGFVVPFSLKRPNALAGFAISRFFRLYPAYWVSLFLAVTVLPLLGIAQYPVKQVVANITMVQFGLGQPNVIGAYWTLFIEMAFYCCCALWFVLGVLRSARFLVLASIGLLSIALIAAVLRYTRPDLPLPVGYINYLAAMHIGTLARLALLEGNRFAKRVLPFVIAAALIASIGISWFAYSKTPDVDPWISGITGLYIGYALFFYCVIRKAFVNRVTLYLGGISYSLYLLHGLTLNVGRSIGYDMAWGTGSLFIIAFMLVLSLPLATLVFRFVEKPSVLVGHGLMRRIRNRDDIDPSSGASGTLLPARS